MSKDDSEFLHSVLQDIYEFEGPGAMTEEDGTISFRGFNQKTVDAYRKSKGLQPKPVNQITQKEAINLFRDEFYNRNGINKLKNKKVLSATLDFAFNSGPKNAARELQRTAGVPEKDIDGIIGKQTMKFVNQAIKERGEEQFTEDLLKGRESFLQNSPEPGVINNLDGLMNRVDKLRQKIGGNR